MNVRSVKSAAEAKSLIESRGMTHVKVGVFDIDGIMRGKYMRKDKFLSSLEKGFGFCDVVLGWDSNDQLYEKPGVQFTGWHTGYPDAEVRLLPGSMRELPLEDNMVFMLGEFAGAAEPVCPRGVLRRVLDRAK
ncbi:MAG: glutamine synthetase, partial [Hyphomicrobiales bacterium]